MKRVGARRSIVIASVLRFKRLAIRQIDMHDATQCEAARCIGARRQRPQIPQRNRLVDQASGNGASAKNQSA